MSPVSPEEVDARRYGGVNGNDITLTEKRTRANRAKNKVIEFKLRNDSLLRVHVNLLFFCFTLFLGNLANSLVLVTLSVVALALHCKHITTSIDFDTLLVVESVGIQISSKKIFAGFNSSQFLPWTTVEDVFINEVITGGAVLLNICGKRVRQRRRENKTGPLVSRIETIQGMPGIHVWGVGKYDRTGTLQEHPTLNVPGSYWLSHKRNIYKFTFKYGESTRDTKEFLYKDELMRVIRRIIKCQPSQGQINTMHLLITYSIFQAHTFWTRQDKMFAMLKFRNGQQATVFPQAFILTISFATNLKCEMDSLIIKNDRNLSYQSDNTVQPSAFSPNLRKTKSFNEYLSQCNKGTKNCLQNLKCSDSPNNLNTSKTMKNETTNCGKNNISTDCNKSSNDTELVGCDMNSAKARDARWEIRNATTDLIFINSLQEASPDFAFARTSSKVCNPSSPHTSTETSKNYEHRSIREMQLGMEQIAPRSSNITNQVMKGLMFTIKQDEDNVKVLEQRTKMELDEVLENSEKVETEEGEKSLVNSSLLKLENLVTKIEIPNKQSVNKKSTDAAPGFDAVSSLSQCSTSNGCLTTGFLGLQWSANNRKHASTSCTDQFPLRSSLNTGWKDWSAERTLNRLPPFTDDSPVTHNVSVPVNGNHRVNENDRDENDNRNDTDDNDNNNNNYTTNDSINNSEVQINMWKLIQDITRGARVIIERISDIDIRNATGQSSMSAATSTERRILTRNRKQ